MCTYTQTYTHTHIYRNGLDKYTPTILCIRCTKNISIKKETFK